MELPRRTRGDELLKHGELLAVRQRLRKIAGQHAVYQAWELFSDDPEDPNGADVAVTGEEFVLLSLLEVVLAIRAPGESVRSAYFRARDCGALNDVPGLMYKVGKPDGPAEE